MNSSPSSELPVIIIGSGLAGLTVALEVADHRQVVMLAKRDLSESATAWAQGGIVGVIDEADDVEAHVADTLDAGAGLVVEPVARQIAMESAAAIDWLINQGVPFTSDPTGPKGLHLVKEGGHSHRRIAHAADATGKAIHEVLLDKAQAHPNISLLQGYMAVDLVVRKHLAYERQPGHPRPQAGCYGVYALNLNTGRVEAMAASAVVIATGGAGKVYRYTSNPETATGDGIAMAWRAGCRVANMEFIQFHPTCLYHSQDRTFLITEALRGEGTKLELPDGTRFMPEHDPRAELAPRDIVARAIDFEMKKHGLDYVNLNATHLGEAFLKEHFPNIYARCLALGIDISKRPIPVVPAAHYTCGGVVTDLQGQTDLPHLFAVGECGYTGLHGANRLASNSLLECVVVGQHAAKTIVQTAPTQTAAVLPWDESLVEDADEAVVISHNWDELRLLMWNYVGIVRTNRRLERALHRIELLKDEVQDYYANFKVSRDLLELRNLLECADLIVRSALMRKESRGLHFSRDYPKTWPVSYPTILTPIKRRAGSSQPL